MANNTQIVPTQLPAAQNTGLYSLLQAFNTPVQQATTDVSGGGSSGSGILGSLFSTGGLGTALAGSGVSGLLSGLGASLAAAAERKQKEKLIAWQIAQAKSNLSPTALSQQGKYINPYTQQNTDAYQNATMGNLLSKFGSDQLAKWGINATPVSSAGETGSTANQLAQYSQQGASKALLAKYGLA